MGNAPGAPLVEVTGSALALRADADTLVCVTGADTSPNVAGRPVPTWDPVLVESGAVLEVPALSRAPYLRRGRSRPPRPCGPRWRPPDPMLGVGRQLTRGDRLDLAACVCGWEHPSYTHALFLLHAPRPTWTSSPLLDVTAGPELEEFAPEELRGP